MVQVPTKTGKAPFKIPSIDTHCFTYYKVFGDLSCGASALIVLHGGPGGGHECGLPFAKLVPQYGLPVVLYDQIGCAASTHLPQKNGDRSFWREELFVAELENLLDHLQLRDGPGYHLLGHSWGGCLAAAFAASQPRGLRRLVLASAIASMETSTQDADRQRAELDPDVRQALDEAERNGEYDSPGYQDGVMALYKKHLICQENFPEELNMALKHLTEDKTVYGTMMGPSHLTVTGTLKDWTVIPRLPQISVPTLVFNGEHDTSGDATTTPFFELIPRVRWVTIAGGGHMVQMEDGRKEKVLKFVGDFLTQGESNKV